MKFYRSAYFVFILLVLYGYSLSAAVAEFLDISLDSPIVSVVFRSFLVFIGLYLITKTVISGKAYKRDGAYLLILFLLIYSFRLIYDLDILNIHTTISKDKYYAFYFLVLFLPTFTVIISRIPVGFSENILRYLKFIIAIALVANLILGLMNYQTLISQGVDSIRLSTGRFNPISMGHLGVSTILLIYIEIKILKTPYSLISLTLLLLGFVAMIMSGSKGPMVAMILTIIYVNHISLGGLGEKLKRLVLVGLVLFSSWFLFTVFNFDMFDRFSSIFSDTELSTVYRLNSYIESFYIFVNNPFFGDSIVLPSGGYPHNILLEILMSIGVVGILLFIVLIAKVNKASKYLARVEPRYMIIIALCFQYLISFMFSGALWQASELFVLIALILSLKSNLKRSIAEKGVYAN